MPTFSTPPILPTTEELERQIGELEEHYIQLFLNNSNREVMKRLHVQIEVLKAELKWKCRDN